MSTIPIEAQITIALAFIMGLCVFLPVGWFYFRQFLKSVPAQKKRRWKMVRRWVKNIIIAAFVFLLLVKIAPQAYPLAKRVWKPHYALRIIEVASISSVTGLILIFFLMVRQRVRGEGPQESAPSTLTKQPKGMSNRQRQRLRRNGRSIPEPAATQQQTEQDYPTFCER